LKCSGSNIFFEECEFQGGATLKSVFEKANFIKCFFLDFYAKETNLNQANFTNSKLEKTKFIKSSLQGVNFKKSILKKVKYYGSTLKNTKFKSAFYWLIILFQRIYPVKED